MKLEDIETECIEAQVESRHHRAEGRRNRAEHRRFLTKIDKYLAKGDTRNAEVVNHLAEFHRLLAEANTLNADAKSSEAKAHKHHAESKRLHAQSNCLVNEADSLYANAERLDNEASGFNWWVFPLDRHEKIAKAKHMVAEAKRLHTAANRTMTKAKRTQDKGNKHIDDANYLYEEADRLITEADRYIAEANTHLSEAKRLENEISSDIQGIEEEQPETNQDIDVSEQTFNIEIESNQGTDISGQSSSVKIEKKQRGQIENSKISKRENIPYFLKSQKKLVELLEYFEKNEILTSEWHKRNINQEDEEKINKELTWLNKKIQKYPSSSLIERRIKQRAIKEYGKALVLLKKSSSLLQRRAELWIIKKEYKKALADLNDAKRKKEIAEKIKITKTTGGNEQKEAKESKQKELQKNTQEGNKESKQKEQHVEKKGENIGDLKGCGCLLLLILIGIGAWGYFFGANESSVNQILTWLWELPDWIKWLLMLLFGIVGIFSLRSIERQNRKKKEINEITIVYGCLLALILAGFWLYFFGTGEPALDQIMDILIWLWELPVWVKLPICLIIVIAGVFSQSDGAKAGCGAVALIGLIGIGIWILFF